MNSYNMGTDAIKSMFPKIGNSISELAALLDDLKNKYHID